MDLSATSKCGISISKGQGLESRNENIVLKYTNTQIHKANKLLIIAVMMMITTTMMIRVTTCVSVIYLMKLLFGILFLFSFSSCLVVILN